MLIVVLTNDELKEELSAQGITDMATVTWINQIEELPHHKNADAYIDLLFQNGIKRIELLEQLKPKPVLLNSVINTSSELPAGFIRFNGWRTFLKRQIIEATGNDESKKSNAEAIFSLFNKKIEWTPDIPGFISMRVIAMIINEAYFALDEKVSTQDAIDVAMTLGTNYPYGPFEWSKKIGLKNVYDLLSRLSEINKRYEPASLLKKQAFE